MTGKTNLRKNLISAGVRNLKEFGYPDVNKDNIMSDFVYAEFFKGILNDALDNGIDDTINEMIEEIDNNLRKKEVEND